MSEWLLPLKCFSLDCRSPTNIRAMAVGDGLSHLERDREFGICICLHTTVYTVGSIASVCESRFNTYREFYLELWVPIFCLCTLTYVQTTCGYRCTCVSVNTSLTWSLVIDLKSKKVEHKIVNFVNYKFMGWVPMSAKIDANTPFFFII